MKEKKFNKYIEKTNAKAEMLNDFLFDIGVITPYAKRKEFETDVYWLAEKDPDFHEELIRLAISTLFIEYEAFRKGTCDCCGKCGKE